MESRVAGMEVPILASDSIKWFQVSVPSTSSSSSSASNSASAATAATRDCASCCVVGNPPTYLIWKISQTQSDILEVLEVVGNEEFPKFGLRIQFPDALFPFAHIEKDKSYGSQNSYLLTAVTVRGLAFLVKLKSVHNYASCSMLTSRDVFEYNMQSNPQCGEITAVTTFSGSLLVGRSDGSICGYQLCFLDPNAPGFMWELRDDVFGRLWDIMSRNTITAAVQDMTVSVVHREKLLFVLHTDGAFCVWDFGYHRKVFTHSFMGGSMFLKLCVGETNMVNSMIPFAVLHKSNMDVEVISLYGMHLGFRKKMMTLTLRSLTAGFSLEGSGPVDIKLTSDRVWILQDDRLTVQGLFGKEAVTRSYELQQALVADQLFQSSEHSADDILWLSHTVLPSSKDQIFPLVSSIFLHRLLLPGVYHSSVLRITLQYYNKHFTDSEFASFTVDGLKNEIVSVIEHEGGSDNLVSFLRCWMAFCAHYCSNWRKTNAVCGLFVDSSTGATCLIRKNMFSICRMFEDIELLVYGSFDDNGYNSSGGVFSRDAVERETFSKLLWCITKVSQQLGKAASALFYESLRSTPTISSEEILPQFVKVLEKGYNSTILAYHVSEIGADVAWEQKVSHHKNLRTFSADMFISLQELCSRASSWGKVLDVIQNYLRFLVPRKAEHKSDYHAIFNLKVSITVEATFQVAKIMFESALDLLLLLSYVVNISGQIQMPHDDVSRIKLELIPMIQEIIAEWHIVHFLATTPTESPALEDFSSQLSSLHIDNSIDRMSLNEKLGKCNFTLAHILLLSLRSCSGNQTNFSSRQLPDCCSIRNYVREFASWIIWGKTGEESSFFLIHSIELAFIFLRHGQYSALEYLLMLVDSYSRNQRICGSLQTAEGEWPTILHLLGCCLIHQTQCGLRRTLKERKVSEAVRCFYRAASMQGAPEALVRLSREAGSACLGFDTAVCCSDASWKLHYYQWVMQIFEQYNLNEAACTFALAALEQVDEALSHKDGGSKSDLSDESTTVVKGRLWANVFKFTLDLELYHEAYCAIISNPDEESKNICLRRFIIVLLERGAVQVLCDGQLPFIGLADKVEQELVWKAARSDVMTKPNPFKLVYAFEVHRHNWRKAAQFIYLYATQLKTEAAMKDYHRRSGALQERLNGLSAAINALQLVHPAYAWVDPPIEELTCENEQYPSKKARIHMEEPDPAVGPRNLQSYFGIEELENEYVLASAECLLSLSNVKWTSTGNKKPSAALVDLLVESNLYDMAFTVILKFWKDSGLKRELERVFAAMSLKCCPHGVAPSGNHRMQNFLLTSSQDEPCLTEEGPSAPQFKGNSQWEMLEIYLEKYKGYHPRLPIVVAETLLACDPQIVLPLWLVQFFKVTRQESGFGMSGSESNPASLFRLYVDHGRYVEATNLLLEYIESFSALRPSDVIRRKRQSSVWFPYTHIERLWCQLEESIRLGHMVDQSEKLKRLLQGALLKHLNLVRIDSEDVQSSTTR
ncbi:OLC1v1038776C1 [Oldenlandia corymbosa var. corymbosa]|uniref:OLC1v1038776C1 n=1 Tax=Oldenlandia corymbosa var. corymbosa TaxID=529605 RepID=A0AAV1D1I2_OLDCO|nr:OLC1v1038776C1 [Oldenlandia corymbosa var. corymbosa]